MSAADRYKIEYQILNQIPDAPPRIIEVHASPEEIDALAEEGYLVRDGMFSGDALEELRDALDRLEQRERRTGVGTVGDMAFGGFFMRYLMDKDPVFLGMMKFQPFLSVARALMGPQIQMSMSARISYPAPENQETMWHQHLRYIPKPLPKWAMLPQCMDVLLYLDDVTDANGPLCIVPGTHKQIQDQPPGNYYGDLPDQKVLYPKAGTAVFLHANLWHRARPTTLEGKKRRLLLFGFYPTWLKRNVYPGKPENGLTSELLNRSDDVEIQELFGKIGYM